MCHTNGLALVFEALNSYNPYEDNDDMNEFHEAYYNSHRGLYDPHRYDEPEQDEGDQMDDWMETDRVVGGF